MDNVFITHTTAFQIFRHLRNTYPHTIDLASPQESRIYIILVSSHAQGGFGIRGLQFNRKIELSENAKQQSGQSVIIPDFCNSKTKIAIEYDSSAYHDINAQNQRDKLRINALRHDGWKTFTFVKSHLNNPYAFKNLAEDILKANKQEKRIRTKNVKCLGNNLKNTFEAIFIHNRFRRR